MRKELKKRIQSELGNKMRSYLWPSSGDALPDNQELKLAVLDPAERNNEKTLRRWLDRKGQSYRAYKNTMFFAVPDNDRYARLLDTIKQYLALQEIIDGINSGDHPALEEKKGEVKRRRDTIADDFPLKVRELYHNAMVPVLNGDLEEIDFGQPAVGRENLDSWYRQTLSSQMHGKILGRPPSAKLLQAKFLSNSDAIALREVMEQFYKNTNLPALDDPQLIAETIANGVQDGSFGLALQRDGEIEPASVRINEPLSATQVSFNEEGWMLLTASKASDLQAQVEPPTDGSGSSAPESGEDGGGRGTGGAGGDVQPGSEGVEPPKPSADETVERLTIRASGIPSSKIYDLSKGVFNPLVREAGEFEFTIEFNVSSADGISKKVIEQTVMETLQQLGAQVEAYDEDPSDM